MFHILDFMFSVNGCIKDMHVYNLHYSENRSKDYNSQSPALPNKQDHIYIFVQ